MSWRGQKFGGMSRHEMNEFLKGPWLARLACLKPDGSPYVVPTWYHWDGIAFWVVPRERAAWAHYMARDPRVCLVVDEPTAPIRKVMCEGTAVIVEAAVGPYLENGEKSVWNVIGERYTGPRYLGERAQEYRGSVNVEPCWTFKIVPRKITTWQGFEWHPPGAADRVAEFEDLTGCPVHLLLRVEQVIDPLLEAEVGFDELVRRFDEQLEAARTGGYRGFKTILAYRTGLAVDVDTSAEAARQALPGSGPLKRRAKPLRDFLTRRLLQYAAEVGLPVQFHTGLGDSDIRLQDANPLLLEDLLRTPEGTDARVVLIHGSYPHHEEAAYLATARPNVYVDVSLFNIFAPGLIADRLLRLVELAPAARVLAATDGFAQPETFWFAATLTHEAWGEVRSQLANLGADDEWLGTLTRHVFEDNARELYGL